METKTTGRRQGKIDGQNIVYEIAVDINNGHICSAEGTLLEPGDLHGKYFGSSVTLIDTATGNSYSIFVSPESFSFHSGYSKVDELFDKATFFL